MNALSRSHIKSPAPQATAPDASHNVSTAPPNLHTTAGEPAQYWSSTPAAPSDGNQCMQRRTATPENSAFAESLPPDRLPHFHIPLLESATPGPQPSEPLTADIVDKIIPGAPNRI